MRLRANRRTERAAVNAARSFLEDNGCVFQEVDGANDYGKDAYVDLGDGVTVSGVCAALQIKGGLSFRTAGGDYRLSIAENHRRIWSESTIPVLGVIHDPEDGLLRWVNISDVLHAKPEAKSVVIPAARVLSRTALQTEVAKSIRQVTGRHMAGVLAQVVDPDEDTSVSAIYDVLAVGRGDPRVLIGLRYLLRGLSEHARLVAIHILSHVTPHPDIFWHDGNWIPEPVKKSVREHFRWTSDEVVSILQTAPIGTFQRGMIGESAYMLLHEDLRFKSTVRYAAELAIRLRQSDAAESALYLMLYWMEERAPTALATFVREFPEAANLPLVPMMDSALREHGYLSLF